MKTRIGISLTIAVMLAVLAIGSILVLVGISAWNAPVVHATTLTVTNLNDSGVSPLQRAITVATPVNSTVSGNNAGTNGGGILKSSSATKVITNGTPSDPVTCTLELDPSYAAGTLTVDVLIGTNGPATGNLWRTAHAGSVSLFSSHAYIIDPPVTAAITETLAPSGTVGLLATLTTPELGIICSDFKTVDTGSPP